MILRFKILITKLKIEWTKARLKSVRWWINYKLK